jgi:hypothetical protein
VHEPALPDFDCSLIDPSRMFFAALRANEWEHTLQTYAIILEYDCRSGKMPFQISEVQEDGA